VGFVGCNLKCPFCQNWRISQSTDAPGRFYTPAEFIAGAKKNEKSEALTKAQVAYTYSEPLVHIEFLLDCMTEGRKNSVAAVLVSNGCVNSEAAEEILCHTDAANIDLKCFSDKTYSEILGGDLSAVTGFIHKALEKGVHLELTTLVVPGLNDSKAELDKCIDFIAELETGGSVVPWHLSAYHPNYKWSSNATDPGFLVAAAQRARKKLSFVYTGNIPGSNNTLCPFCGKTLVSRSFYKIDTLGISLGEENGRAAYFCASCGRKAPFVF
jgi:pyruvate formate lyase activating enzyme